MTSAVSGVANFISFLQSRTTEGPAAAPANEQSMRLLSALQKARLLPLRDVPLVAGVSPDGAARLVDELRTRGLVELVEKEPDKSRFLRLTPRGFDTSWPAPPA